MNAAAIVVIALTVQANKAPSLDDLAGLTFSLGPEDKRVVTLVNGTGRDNEGSTFTLQKVFATGDLNNDKTPDIAAILLEDGGGTGRFYYLFTFMNKSGSLVQLEQPEWLGDRSQIKQVRINRGVLGVRFVTHKPDDPPCCPTLEVENRYRFVKDRLVPLDDPQ
jgi:hypothetical protein